jgi:transposase-like protein
VAVAVNEDGRREVLGIATGPSEAEVFWTGFLRGLADRGLRGVKLVIADDHKGLRAAAGRVAGRDVSEMPRALGEGHAGPCRDQAPWGGLGDAQDDLRSRQNKAAALEQWDEVADALRSRHPKLGEMMDASREDVLAYMDFPREHWPQIASTNPLERLNREIKRRSDVVGIFPNDAAVIRLTGALMLEASDEWAVTRRSMSLEALARVVQAEPVSLPTTAA